MTEKENSEVWIRPYVNQDEKGIGLEKHNMVLHSGVKHEEYLWVKDRNGIKTYVTGLNEFDPEIQGLSDTEKNLKITEIRTIVAELEMQLASNKIKVSDENFWEKVTVLKPNNDVFWGQLKIELTNKPKILKPAANPNDRILIECIKSGGFASVSKSLEDITNGLSKAKWYLSNPSETMAFKTGSKKIVNKAISILDGLYEKKSNKLLLLAKCLDPNPTKYKSKSSYDYIYDKLDDYIKGALIKGEKEKLATKFIDHSKLTLKDLKTRAVVLDSIFEKVISVKSDGYLHFVDKHIALGKSVADVLSYVNNPANEEVLGELTAISEQKWNR